jgi:hypothetical protein
MLFSLFPLSSSLHASGHGTYSASYIYIADFGFYANGTFTLSSNAADAPSPLPVRFVLFTEKEYENWVDSNIRTNHWRRCVSISAPNIPLILDSVNQTWEFTVQSKATYVAIVQHCNHSQNARYFVDAHFRNPNGFLDSRDVPSQTVLPVMICLFGPLLLGWIVYCLVQRRSFLKIHLCLVAILALYIVYLVVYAIALSKAQRTDDDKSWWIAMVAAESIYDLIFYSTLVIASTGWCLLHTELSLGNVAMSVFSVAVFVAATAVQVNVELGYWQILVVVVQISAVLWILHCIYVNTGEAQKHIKAHLLVITQGGIDPMTTPVYEKLTMYTIMIWLVGVSFLSFLFLNLLLSVFDAVNWVYVLGGNIVQLGIAVAILWLYRPRGAAMDKYLRDDEEGERGEVLLEDLEGFDVTGDRAGMRQWEEGMDLPPEPLLISSRDPTRPMIRDSSTNPYTPVGY